MRRTSIVALITVYLVIAPLPTWAGDETFRFPNNGEGYTITKTDTHQMAPEGFEGATDTTKGTAIGNSPSTQGTSIETTFTISNQIPACPDADGTVNGEGLLTFSTDATYADGTTPGHVKVTVKAKYKGQVGDDALIKNPVNADIDFSWVQSGTLRSPNGAPLPLVNKSVEQHLTIPILVAGLRSDLTPMFGKFEGGDPTQAEYFNAVALGLGLSLQGGFYYAVALTNWTQANTCVQAEFNPPSRTLKLVPGGQMKVETQVKTKTGVRAKAHYPAVHADIGTVEAMQAYSDVGTPMKVTYTAPDHISSSSNTAKPGFAVSATSPAGAASATWEAGLGTNWSGQITCEKILSGAHAGNSFAFVDDSYATRITINVTDGKGKATGYTEAKAMEKAMQRVASGGSILDHSSESSASIADAGPADVQVTIDKASGTYSIQIAADLKKVSTRHTVSCAKYSPCTTSDTPFYVDSCLAGIGEKLDDPNHLQGSKYDVVKNANNISNATLTTTMSWDLARQGTTQ